MYLLEIWMFKVLNNRKQRFGASWKSAHFACLSSEMAHALKMVQNIEVILQDFFRSEICNFLFDVNNRSDYSSWLLTGIGSLWSCFDVVLTVFSHFDGSQFYHIAFFGTPSFVHFCVVVWIGQNWAGKGKKVKRHDWQFIFSSARYSDSDFSQFDFFEQSFDWLMVQYFWMCQSCFWSGLKCPWGPLKCKIDCWYVAKFSFTSVFWLSGSAV